MSKSRTTTEEQARWNEYGFQRMRDLEEAPEKHVILECPLSHLEACTELLQLLQPLKNKRILELGCGRGEFAVWMSMQGAEVTALDIGEALLAAGSKLAQFNETEPTFCQADIANLPFASETFDAVVGTAILHHLPEAGVRDAVHECYRVLSDEGVAVFHEPVENSQAFNFVQNLFPVGSPGSQQHRPSILQRAAWQSYLQTMDDRPLTNRELVAAGHQLFHEINISPYGMTVRVQRLIGTGYSSFLTTLDNHLLRAFPPLRRFSQTALIHYCKKSGPCV